MEKMMSDKLIRNDMEDSGRLMVDERCPVIYRTGRIN